MQDAPLSARLLKIVNSPFYKFPSKVDTVSMVITIVGTRQLRDLAAIRELVTGKDLVIMVCGFGGGSVGAAPLILVLLRLSVSSSPGSSVVRTMVCSLLIGFSIRIASSRRTGLPSAVYCCSAEDSSSVTISW